MDYMLSALSVMDSKDLNNVSKNEEEFEEEEEEEELPKLKYARLKNHLTGVLAKRSATCLAVHPKLICVGTNWGSIHLFDHLGNTVRSSGSLAGHSVAINKISMDERGDFVASCSDDGYVHIRGLYTSDNDYDLNVGRLVKSVAIDPLYYKLNTHRRFITGDERLVLHEKALLYGYKFAASWLLAAETCDLGNLRIVKESKFARCSIWFLRLPSRIMTSKATNQKIEDEVRLKLDEVENFNKFRPKEFVAGALKSIISNCVDWCSLIPSLACDPNRSTLISEAEGYVQNISWSKQFVAWASDIGVRVYDIDNKCSLGLMKWTENPAALPSNYRCNMCWLDDTTLLIGWVDIVRVCSIRRRHSSERTISIHQKELPAFMVELICTFTTDFYISGIAALVEPLHKSELNLVLLGYAKEPDEDGNAKRPTLQIVQPLAKDYVEIAGPDELIFREYKTYQCNDYHLESVKNENRYFIVSPRDIVVACPYDANDKVAWLIKHQRFEEALEAVKDSTKYTMLEVGRAYIDYLLLKNEYQKAGELCQTILGKEKKLWEEEVYKFAQVHQLKAISPYLPVGDYKLDQQVYEMVLYEFLKTDPPGFLKLIKKWPPHLYHVPAIIGIVINQLIMMSMADVENVILLEALAILYTHDKRYDLALQMYLRVRDKNIFSLIIKHKLYPSVHNMVEQLMELDPEQAVALFLNNYCIPVAVVVEKLQNNRKFLHKYLDALDKQDKNGEISRKYQGQLIELHADFAREKLLPFLRRSDHYPIQEALNICQERKLFPEMVHLLARMGNSKEALTLMTDELKDIKQATDFCKEQDDQELWENLIKSSLNKPEFITYLLQNIGTAIDPRLLVRKIAPGLPIPGLQNSLCKMMKDYRLQVSVQEGCKKILVKDYFNLQERLINTHKRGIRVDDEQICGACNGRTIHRGDSNTNLVIFYCKHVFHEDCLNLVLRCLICDSQVIRS